MKIEQDVQTFQPVVITLESMEEVNALQVALLARAEVIVGLDGTDAEYEFLETFTDFLHGVG